MVNEINNFGYCGKNCLLCDSFKQDSCQGCKSVLSKNKKISTKCEACNIKFCAEKKGISFCFVCSKFPCQYFSYLSKEEISKLYEHKTLICYSDDSKTE